MSLFSRKLWRELRGQRSQSLAVAGVTALGVALFVTTAGSYRDLRDSYATTRSRLGLAGLHVELPRVETNGVAAVVALPGVALAEARLETEVPLALAEGRARLRVLSLPDTAAPRLDQPLVLEGALPSAGEVLLEKHFARFHGLHAGSSVRLGAGAGTLLVSGVAVSPEYLWVSRNANDFMPSPAQFGVGWMRRAGQRELAVRVLEHGGAALSSPSLVLAASDSPGNQLLVQPRPGVAPARLRAEVEAALGSGPSIRATPTDELVGVKLMQMDLDGYRGMAAFFPFFFLGVGAFIVGSGLARLVDAQRTTIGTLLALGVGRPTLLWHYLAFALWLGAGGAALGALGGQLGAPLLTQTYAEELGIPFVESHLHLGIVLQGLLMGAGVALLAGVLPAIRAVRLQPAEAMRPAPPRLGPLARFARRLPLPLAVRLPLRNVLGRPLRSLGTALGVAAAVVLILATGVLLDSMKQTFSALFEQAQTYDVRVDFAAPVPTGPAIAAVVATAGVQRAEAMLSVPAQVTAGSHQVEVLLQAFSEKDTLVRPVDVDGRLVPPGSGGITLTRGAARKLEVGVGGRVTVWSPPAEAPLELTVTGFADAAMGSSASVRRADLEDRWRLTGMTTGVVAAASAGRSGEVRAALETVFPDAVRIEDAAATRVQFEQLMGLGWVMLGVMLVFGGVLAAAILFNTATLSVLEHQREFATLRALGRTMREITVLITVEHGLLTLLGLGLGWPLALLAAKGMLWAFQSELFSLPFVLTAPTAGVTLAGVAVMVLLAQWPALRRVQRSNLAEAVKVREG